MNGNPHLHREIEKLRDDARLTRRAHYLASERKKRWFRIIGITVIFFNALIASGAADALAVRLEWSPLGLVKGIAVLIGALIGIQTFLPLNKDYETHLAAGEAYANVYRKLRVFIARINDGARLGSLEEEYKRLLDDYLAINERYKNCVPLKKDFEQITAELRLLPAAESILDQPRQSTS